jgi:hypothetical protein
MFGRKKTDEKREKKMEKVDPNIFLSHVIETGSGAQKVVCWLPNQCETDDCSGGRKRWPEKSSKSAHVKSLF